MMMMTTKTTLTLTLTLTVLILLVLASITASLLFHANYHCEAEIQEMLKQNDLEYFDQLEVNFNGPNKNLIKSNIVFFLQTKWTNLEAKLSSFNEATVSFHTMLVIQDVLKCLHLQICGGLLE
jgi:hypothetical protein